MIALNDLQRFIENYQSDEFKCPHCGESYTVYDELYGIDYRDGEEYEIECECGQDFKIQVSITVTGEVVQKDSTV